MSKHFYVLVFTLFLALCAVSAEDKATRDCVNLKMDACNNVVKKAFMNPTEGASELQVYCDAMKVSRLL